MSCKQELNDQAFISLETCLKRIWRERKIEREREREGGGRKRERERERERERDCEDFKNTFKDSRETHVAQVRLGQRTTKTAPRHLA